MPNYTKEEQFKLIDRGVFGWANLQEIDNQYEEVCLAAIKKNGLALRYVKEQTPEICLEAVKQNVRVLQYVKEQTPEICLTAVKNYGYTLRYVKEQTPEICLAAVKENGNTLVYVKEQTPELCLEAINNTPWALEHIKEQTPEICLEAVKQDGRVLEYVKEQTPEICLEAVKKYGEVIKKIKNRTPEMCFYAFLNDYSLLSYKYIKNGVNKFIENNSIIKDCVFCDREYKLFITKGADFVYFNINSLIYLKDYLIKGSSNNKFILKYSTNLYIPKEIALSNNELILIDEGNTKDIDKILANKIIKKEDLSKESF